MSDVDRLLAALDGLANAPPLEVTPAREELEVVRKQADVAVDEVLLAPVRWAAGDAEVVSDGPDILVDKVPVAHAHEFKEDHAAVRLDRLELARRGAPGQLAVARLGNHIPASEPGRDAPVKAKRPAQVRLELAAVAHVDAE